MYIQDATRSIALLSRKKIKRIEKKIKKSRVSLKVVKLENLNNLLIKIHNIKKKNILMSAPQSVYELGASGIKNISQINPTEKNIKSVIFGWPTFFIDS